MAKKLKISLEKAQVREEEDISNDSYEASSDESAEEWSDDELEGDAEDEFDVEGVSLGDSEDEDDSEEEDDDDDNEEEEDDSFPTKRKSAKTSDGSEAFSSAVTAILGSKLKAYDRKDPILARNKLTIKKLELDKLEAKAKRALLAEKKQLQEKHRVRRLIPAGDGAAEALAHERHLKKSAQKGVVRLFNAILATQIKTEQQLEAEIGGEKRKQELMNEISKEKFLDLVQAAGNE